MTNNSKGNEGKGNGLNFLASVHATSKKEHRKMMTKFAEEQVK